MGILLHPFLVGQPLHIKYFARAIEYLKRREGAWFATGSEITSAYAKVR